MNSPALIPFDCSDEEIGLILKQALNDLRLSTDEIIQKANKRMDECQARLSEYKNRLTVVEQKFEAIQKSDEIPLITSPAEFPGKVHLSRPLVFSHSSSATSFTNQQKILKNDHTSKPLTIKEMVLRKNGYRFIFPKGKYNEVLMKKKLNSQNETKTKGFIRPEEFYNLKLNTSVDTRFSSNNDFASNSLLIYENLRTVDSTDPFAYKPGMGSLTEFDLPTVLPQLSGVTKNAYTQRDSIFGAESDEDEDEIFGEVSKRSLDLDLTARSTFYMPDNSNSRRSTTQSKILTPKPNNNPFSTSGILTPSQVPTTSAIIQQPVIQPIIQPPVIQPVIPTTQIETPKAEVPIAPPRSIDSESRIPIPPAPPAPMNLLASIPSPPTPGRADLMEAIRAAGGAKKAGLKKIENHEDEDHAEKPPKKTSAAVESTDDLMSSLTKALERRRKGISGKTAKKFAALEKSQTSNTNATFSSLRELIPPPTKGNNSDSESPNEAEEDWK